MLHENRKKYGKSFGGSKNSRTFAPAKRETDALSEARRTSRAAREKQVYLVFRVVKEVKAERR